MAGHKTMREKSRWRKIKSVNSQDDSDDWGSLTWLLSFRLDEMININVHEEERQNKEVKVWSDVSCGEKKPPYTYPELIERALRAKGELTVSGIYQWISDRYPYYNANDERWKNSIRHNLSINPHFRKGARSPQGAGHLWSLAANAIDLLPSQKTMLYTNENIEVDKTDIADSDCCFGEIQFINCPKVIVLDEAALAAASIMPHNEFLTDSPSKLFLNPVSSEQVVRESGLLSSD